MKSILILLFSVTFLSFGQINWISIGPEGGNLRKIVVDPFNPLHIIALPVESTDGGSTWRKKFSTNVVEFHFDPFEPATCLMLTVDDRAFPSSVRVFKSNDGGATWTIVFQIAAVSANLFPDATMNGRVFLVRGRQNFPSDSSDVFVSTDRGNTWRRIFSSNSPMFSPIILSLFGNPSRLVLARYNGVDTSSNGGVTWGSIDTIFVNGVRQSIRRWSIADLTVHPNDPHKWYMRYRAYALLDSLAFLRSFDGGVHWQSMSGVSVPRDILVVPPPPNNATPIRFQPLNPDTMYFASSVGVSFVYRSSNQGVTWTKGADSLTLDEVQDIAYVDGQHALRLSTRGFGMYRVASDLSQITLSNAGVRLLPTSDLFIPDRSAQVFSAIGFYKFVFSTNGGATWQQRSTGINVQWIVGLRIRPIGPSSWYAVGTGDITPRAVFTTSNAGSNWGFAGGWLDVDIVPSDSLVVFRHVGGIDKSIDGGRTWVRKLNPPSAGGSALPSATARWLVTHKHNSGTVFAVINRASSFSNLYQLFRSTNSGESWDSLSLPVSNEFLNQVNGIWFDPQNSSRVYLAYNNWILCNSLNNGSSWTVMTNPVAGRVQPRVNDLLVAPTNSAMLFAATEYGVFRSTDIGVTWSLLVDSLSSFPTVRLALGRNDTLFAASFISGIHKTSRSVLTGIQESSPLPPTFFLTQNYPNPFNPTTTIRFQLPIESMVRLSVFDLLGREVAVLVNERRNSGAHSVEVDAVPLSSGVYFYRLQAGSYSETKKMIILR